MKNHFFIRLLTILPLLYSTSIIAQEKQIEYNFYEKQFIQDLKNKGADTILVFKTQSVGSTSAHVDSDGAICEQVYDIFITSRLDNHIKLKNITTVMMIMHSF